MEAYAWARYREGEQHRLSDPKAQAACYQDAGKWRLAALKCRPTAGAQYLRGRLLYTGDDTDEEALYWFMCAADAGEAQAMQVVLHMLQGKAGKVAGDRVLYEYWQQKAAAAGMDVAQSPERDAAQTAERDAALPQMPGGQDSQKAGGPTLDTRRAGKDAATCRAAEQKARQLRKAYIEGSDMRPWRQRCLAHISADAYRACSNDWYNAKDRTARFSRRREEYLKAMRLRDEKRALCAAWQRAWFDYLCGQGLPARSVCRLEEEVNR